MPHPDTIVAPARADRPVLLLLPGLLCDEQVWAQQREALGAAVDCRVPDWGQRASLTDMAGQALAMAGTGGFSLAGHSMGGRVALEVVRLAPERVQRLMLMDTGVDPLPEGEAGVQERDKRLALLAVARAQGMRAMGAEWARGMVHPSRLDGPLFAEILAMIERRSPAQFEAQIQALLARPDARGVLSGVRCPTVLLCGRQDAWSPLSRHEEMQRLRPASRLVVIEDSGHMSTMEQPAAVTAALRAWMEMVS